MKIIWLILALFRFFVGDLIPENLEIWNVWIKLREMLDIILSPNVQFSEHIRLQYVIEEYLDLIIEYFKVLKPKHHHLLHYSKVMFMSGPLVNL